MGRAVGRIPTYVEDLLSPELFILGGGISKKHAKFLQHLTADTPVVPAEMRNEAGIVGRGPGR